MPPVAFVALLALSLRSAGVHARIAALSCAYFGSTAIGKRHFAVITRSRRRRGMGGAAFGLASATGGGGAAGAAAGAAIGVASAPHWALRKSFHFMPLRVPPDLAA